MHSTAAQTLTTWFNLKKSTLELEVDIKLGIEKGDTSPVQCRIYNHGDVNDIRNDGSLPVRVSLSTGKHNNNSGITAALDVYLGDQPSEQEVAHQIVSKLLQSYSDSLDSLYLSASNYNLKDVKETLVYRQVAKQREEALTDTEKTSLTHTARNHLLNRLGAYRRYLQVETSSELKASVGQSFDIEFRLKHSPDDHGEKVLVRVDSEGALIMHPKKYAETSNPASTPENFWPYQPKPVVEPESHHISSNPTESIYVPETMKQSIRQAINKHVGGFTRSYEMTFLNGVDNNRDGHESIRVAFKRDPRSAEQIFQVNLLFGSVTGVREV